MSYEKRILITGGAGFIGSHVVRLFVNKYPNYQIINLDKLTYAGNLDNIKDIENAPNYLFEKADICDFNVIQNIFSKYTITDVIHLAAESHVDRSIANPMEFVLTNVVGTVNLLNVAKSNWINLNEHVFYHISTDEVYGSLGEEGLFHETTAYDPRSPYSASKASSDHFVRAYHETFGLQVKISNCSNNYGPYQFPEKLIPLIIHNIVYHKPLPVYGKGENVRDWLHVEDHALAIDLIFHKGKNGETYNVGGSNERKNIDLVETICDLVDTELGRELGSAKKLITFVKDRAGHDLRYAIDATKLKTELGWNPQFNVDSGLKETVKWYLNHSDWIEKIVSGEYLNYYQKQYHDR
jgi:dTDP-glucose 4,6-dehydratase